MQLPEIDFDKLANKKWVAYFDLLGSKNRKALELYEIYATCLQEAEWNTQQIDAVQTAYFSDTFLLYTPDDSKKSLNGIDMAARGFFDDLIDRDIPVRGAMACNEFYPDKANGIYLGQALVEAHEVGEKYNWLGFVLHQSALESTAKTGRTAIDRGHYKKWNAEFRNKPTNIYDNEEVTAYFSFNSLQNMKNMASCVSDESIKRKYRNSIAFLEAMELRSHSDFSCSLK